MCSSDSAVTAVDITVDEDRGVWAAQGRFARLREKRKLKVDRHVGDNVHTFKGVEIVETGKADQHSWVGAHVLFCFRHTFRVCL